MPIGWNSTHNQSHPLDEAFASFASCWIRGDPWYETYGISIDDDAATNASNPNIPEAVAKGLMGVMWDLDHYIVYITLKNYSPQTIRAFYNAPAENYYRTNISFLNQVFINHGFDPNAPRDTLLPR